MMLYCAFKVRGTETFTTQTLYNVVFFLKKRKSMGTVCLKALWEHINSNALSIV